MALLGLLTLTVAAAGKDKEVPSAASAAALAQQLAAQAKQIKALERQVSRLSGGGSCAADAEDPEPELQAFRAAERQKRAMKRQDELVTLFTATVRAKKRRRGGDTHVLNRAAPLPDCAGRRTAHGGGHFERPAR